MYPLSCCSYGQPGDIISTVEVTSDDPDDSTPGPVSNILSFYNFGVVTGIYSRLMQHFILAKKFY